MTDDRKTLKLNPDTFDRLKAAKAKYQTWDGHLLDLLERAQREADP